MSARVMLALAWLVSAPPPPPEAPSRTAATAARGSRRPPDPPDCRRTPNELTSRTAPSLTVLHAAALSRSPVDDRALRSWQRRARASAALPSVSVGWDHRRDRGYDLDQMVGTADDFSSDGVAANTFRVRVDWSLDRLVFNPDELRAARAALDWLDWREHLLERVTALYAEYGSLLADYRWLRSDGGCSPEAAAVERQLREVAGHLLALTGHDLLR